MSVDIDSHEQRSADFNLNLDPSKQQLVVQMYYSTAISPAATIVINDASLGALVNESIELSQSIVKLLIFF
jgi:hypothetical protein